MKRKNSDIDFNKIFKGKKIPLLTLDERWHALFPDYNKPVSVKVIENNLNDLIKQQGKLINDMKGLKQLKNKLLQEIITHMDVNDTKEGKLKAKKLEKNQKLIKEIGNKMKKIEDELIDLPYKIKEMNENLIIESSIVCYERLNVNNKKVAEISVWVAKVREDLKEKILEKQDMEMKNTEIYSYMHDVLGAELMQELDEKLKTK